MVKHIDLFSGIGGFALAAERVWPGIEHVFCDNEKFCQAIINKHWPGAKIYGDIRALTNTASEQSQLTPERKGRKDTRGRSEERTFILTGGFPCQPFSQAGQRKGTEDDRYLWPEMFRVIREFQPVWVIAENVRGLVTWNDGMVLEQVCADLEAEGYEVQPIIIPAVAVNAPHRRDRVWFIAHSNRNEYRGRRGTIRETKKVQGINRKELCPGRTCGTNEDVITINSHSHRRSDGNDEINTTKTGKSAQRDTSGRHCESCEVTTDSDTGRIRRHECESDKERTTARDSWNRNWVEIASELCRVDDGVSEKLGEVTLSPAKHREHQLKAYGNAIVPQVAEQIMRAIKETNDTP